MKVLKYAVILLLGLSMATMMTSCTKDKAQLIVGEWETVSVTYVSNGALHNGGYAGLVYTFNDKTTNFPQVLYNLPYEINDNTLTVISEDSFTIVELTSSSLILENGRLRYELKRM